MAIDQNELRRKALLDQMGPQGGPPAVGVEANAPGPVGPMAALQADPMDSAKNTGISGGLDVINAKAPAGTLPGVQPEMPPAGAPPKPATSFGKAPAGYDQTKWDNPDNDSAKYITARSINYDKMRQIPDEAGRKTFLAQEVQRITPDLAAKGWTVHGTQGDKMLVSGHGYPPGLVDVVGDIEGAATPAWQPESDNAPQGGGAAAGGQMPGDLASQALGQVPKFGGQAIDPRLQGDPLQAILQALSQMSGGAPNQQALLQQLRG